jgi:DNA-binding MarR family transcriptional regulator
LETILPEPSRQTLITEVVGHLRAFVVGILLSSLEVTEAVGLNSTDLGCLCLLLLQGPSPAGRLAEVTGLTTGAVTGIIDRLEEAGFVRRVPDTRDRRKVIVSPNTEKVERELMPLFLKRQAAADPGFYERFSVEELRVINDFLSRLTAMSPPA